MKKLLIPLLLCFIAITLTATAQTVPNSMATDCDGNSEWLYDSMEEGKVMVVAMLAYDCSICNGDAPYVRDFFNENSDKVHIWAPMFNLVHPNSRDATCEDMAAWNERHNWQGIFAFVNDPITWAYEYGVHYIVIDPIDKTVYYRGNNVFTMQEKVLELYAVSDVEEEGTSVTEGIFPNPLTDNGTLSYNARRTSAVTITVYDVLGKIVHQEKAEVVAGNNQLELSFVNGLAAGSYSVIVSSEENMTRFPLQLQ